MENLVIQIASAITVRTLYPASHPRVTAAVNLMLTSAQQIIRESGKDSLTFLIVGDDLVVEDHVIRKANLSQMQFVELLKRREIERLTLAAGLPAEEAHAFIDALSEGRTPESSAHLKVGRVQVTIEDERTDEKRPELTVDQLEIVRESFANFRKEQKLPFSQMEQLVWSFIDSLSRTTRAVLPLAKLKEHDEYTFVHSVNVSLLVLAQARSFGIKGAMLHAFGMAGLLHDLGKLMIPLDVLNKPGKLEGEQWALMQSHAEKGAWLLSEMESATPLTVVVAYEHHLRYDGQPNYPVLKKPRLPNLVSRMTSIADTYDAMSTIRPYQQPLGRATAVEILQKRAETFYDPVLVANFIQLLSDASRPHPN